MTIIMMFITTQSWEWKGQDRFWIKQFFAIMNEYSDDDYEKKTMLHSSTNSLISTTKFNLRKWICAVSNGFLAVSVYPMP